MILEFFDHQGVRFHFRRIGEGFPVILTHGLGGDLTAMHRIFGELPGVQSVYWDCRGHGRTEPVGPAEGYSFETFAGDLMALMNHLELEKVALVGISMGAAISAQVAMDHPDRVAALALIRPAWLDQPDPENLRVFRTIAQLLGEGNPREALARFEALPEVTRIQAESPDVYQSVCAQFLLPKSRERRVRLDRMPLSTPLRGWEETARITAPTLVIGTGRDPVHPLAFAKTWAAKVHGAQFLEILSKSENLEEHTRILREEGVAFLHRVVG